MIRVGLIGVGKHGSRYGNHIVNDCSGLQLTAIARRSEEGKRQAQLWGAQWFSDWSELVSSCTVDAVICAVPPVLNLDIARMCCLHNKPLLVEKPLAGSVADGEALVGIMHQGNNKLTVGQTLRYNPVIRRIKSEFSERGNLVSIYANQRLEPSGLRWLDDPKTAGAGISFHTAVHVFDALHYVTGLKIIRIFALCRAVQTRNCEDSVQTIFEMENGVVGVADFSKLSSARSGRYEFVFNDSQLHGDQIHGSVSSLEQNVETVLEKYEPVPTIVSLLEDWHTFLTGNGANPVEPEDGLYAINVSHACLKSSAQNRWVDV